MLYKMHEIQITRDVHHKNYFINNFIQAFGCFRREPKRPELLYFAVVTTHWKRSQSLRSPRSGGYASTVLRVRSLVSRFVNYMGF